MPCGPGRIGDWLVPDHPLGAPFTEVCRLHDRAYGDPKGLARADIDWLFYQELLEKAGTRRAWRVLAWVYWKAVRLLGRGAFSGTKKRTKVGSEEVPGGLEEGVRGPGAGVDGPGVSV